MSGLEDDAQATGHGDRCLVTDRGDESGGVSAIGLQALSEILVIAAMCLWVWCLVDFLRTDEREIRAYLRNTWIILLAFCSVLGALMWAAVGRPPSVSRR